MPSVSGIQMSSRTRSGRPAIARDARFGGVFRQLHVVTLVAQDLEQQLAYPDFVVNHQYLRHFPKPP
jgi:hypothetical protein